ncbi:MULTISPECIES: phenylalanine--tRNA ligase subunit alpha [unclassified Sporolactobacillus]|uniref:phenylalanine--tRNA ligase subunit alpha n=1 Tax=unclassified Sporolactobacillus TaxID=2628533 RepID=UPI00236889CC|nr:phenylalanine--tRNA ligase subunit alpha [Sporolactobacillus sp. CQH2019]MDD9147881.1 phenylalanine--tRNA ligase subunit alpha [Sporolactobacillus sp. CQH2019]
MQEKLLELRDAALKNIGSANSLKQLQDIHVRYLGKKGPITEVLKGMGRLAKEERPVIGQLANDVRKAIGTRIEGKKAEIEAKVLEARLESERIDVTLPGRKIRVGGHHLLASVIREVEDLFIGLGFSIAEGPEVEEDYYNFEALNLPKDHPARDMQDSFYITDEVLLRTHTSPMQARTLEAHKGKGPVKIICPGKVYRRDNDDATHSHQFMQIEGLYVDKNVRLSDLKGVLTVFAKHVFGAEREIRLRPSFFPFTEPSVEMDISCFRCGGRGCSVCKGTGWIEILGAGMVHPNVLRMSGFDPSVYTGFAFGMGPERIAMLKYGIEDIRHFYTDDLRFLRQFKRA